MYDRPMHVIIPTTGERPEKLKQAVESIEKTTKNYDLTIVLNGKKKVTNINHSFKLLEYPGYIGWAQAIINATKEIPEDDYLFLFADDAEMLQEGWDTTAREVFEALWKDRIGILCFDDGYQCGRIATHPFTTRKTLEFYGTYNAGYSHYFFDTDVSMFSKYDGRYLYLPLIKIYHKHWLLGRSEKDEIYQIGEKKFWAHDEDIYNRRLFEKGFIVQNNQLQKVK